MMSDAQVHKVRFEPVGVEMEVEEGETVLNAAFRRWVEAPENAGRPIQEAPQYWDRIAIGTLQERRTWWE